MLKYYGVTGTYEGSGGGTVLDITNQNVSVSGTKLVFTNEYTRVEYLQGTGTQWINTGIACNSKYKIEMRFKMLTFETATAFLFGWYYEPTRTTSKPYRFYYRGNANPNYRWQYDTSYDISTTDLPTDNNWHTIIANKGTFTCDNTVVVNITNYTEHSAPSPFAIPVFTSLGKNYSDASPSPTPYTETVQISSFKITDTSTNEVVRDLIPVKDKFGIPCMYDIVSETCFYNQGTGDFTAGPEIGGVL